MGTTGHHGIFSFCFSSPPLKEAPFSASLPPSCSLYLCHPFPLGLGPWVDLAAHIMRSQRPFLRSLYCGDCRQREAVSGRHRCNPGIPQTTRELRPLPRWGDGDCYSQCLHLLLLRYGSFSLEQGQVTFSFCPPSKTWNGLSTEYSLLKIEADPSIKKVLS